MPNSNPAPFVKHGAFEADSVNLLNTTFEQQLNANVTPVSLTNPTSATDMMTYVVNAGVLNVVGRGIELFASGTYNLAAASTVVITIKLGGVTLATFTTASQATTSVTLGWNLYYFITTVSIGSAATVESHGSLNFDSGATLAAACSTFNDSNTAVSSAINLTLNATLEVMANFGTGNGASVIAQRMLTVSLLN